MSLASYPTAHYQIARYKQSRFWAVYDPAGQLICLTVYKKGAEEVVRRLLMTNAQG